MPSADSLPTFKSATWTITSLRDSLLSELSTDTSGKGMRLFVYALSSLGWAEVRKALLSWKKDKPDRSVVAYVGTDHGLTDPDALESLTKDGVEVWIPTDYTGIFHPKVVWLNGAKANTFWIGSNNFTREGLLNNIECATVIRSSEPPSDMEIWYERIHSASEQLTPALLQSYREERTRFNAGRASVGTFVWSRRSHKKPTPAATPSKKPATDSLGTKTEQVSLGVSKGDLILEIMPLETGSEGKQVQFPIPAVVSYFGLPNRVRASKAVSFAYLGGIDPRRLTVTIFGNRTTRLSLNELDYRDRPCVIRVHRTGTDRYEYEIVQKSIFPKRYDALLALCSAKTREGSRRWGMVT